MQDFKMSMMINLKTIEQQFLRLISVFSTVDDSDIVSYRMEVAR